MNDRDTRKSRPSLARLLTTAGLALAVTLPASLTAGALEPVSKTTFGGIAVSGYDPVAYFTEGAPTKGDSKLSYEWREANWYFSSEKNLDLFKADPEKYAPQYGGYCAWAVSQNSTAKSDPKAWTIVNDKLYLNYNKKIQAKWEEERDTNIAKAEKNWPGLLGSD